VQVYDGIGVVVIRYRAAVDQTVTNLKGIPNVTAVTGPFDPTATGVEGLSAEAVVHNDGQELRHAVEECVVHVSSDVDAVIALYRSPGERHDERRDTQGRGERTFVRGQHGEGEVSREVPPVRCEGSIMVERIGYGVVLKCGTDLTEDAHLRHHLLRLVPLLLSYLAEPVVGKTVESDEGLPSTRRGRWIRWEGAVLQFTTQRNQ